MTLNFEFLTLKCQGSQKKVCIELGEDDDVDQVDLQLDLDL